MKALRVLAALLALGGAAEAGTKTQVISFDGDCDVLTLKIQDLAVVGTDACTSGIGIGYVGASKGFGRAIVAGLQFPAAPGAQFVIRISRPLVTGGEWDMYYTIDGSEMALWDSGTYTVQGTADKGPRGTKSVLDSGPRQRPQLKP